MNYSSVIFIICTIISLTTFGQDTEKKNAIGLGLGFQATSSQDLVFSPMIYKGSSLGVISLSYQRFAQKGFHKLRIYYDEAKVESTELITFPTFGGPVTRVPSTASFINIQYQYAHYVLQKNPINLAIGGMLDNQAHLMEYIWAQ